MKIDWKDAKIPWKQILAIVVLLLAFVFFRSERKEMSEIIPNLQAANTTWVLVGIALTFIYILLQAAMYIASFKAIGLSLTWRDAIELFLKRNFLSVFLPVGGVTSLAYTPTQLRKKNFNATQIYQAGGIYGFVGLFTVFLVGIPVIILSVIKGTDTKEIWWSVVILGFILSFLFFVVHSFRSKNFAYQYFEKKFPSKTENFRVMFEGNVNKKYFYITIAISTIIEFCGIFHAYIAMYALGLNTSFEAAALGYTISVLLMIVSPFLRGLGAVEFTMIYIFSSYGYNHSQALAITLLYRVFEFWLPIVFGIFAFLWRGRVLMARIIPAIGIFVLGKVNIISVITPPLMERLRLEHHIPIEAIYFSKMMVLFIGIVLLVTSAYLIKGLKSAWNIALGFSLLSFFGNLIKGLDYVEAAIALVTFLLLLVSRFQYRLKTSKRSLKRGFSVFFIVFFGVMIFNFCSFYFMDRSHFGVDFTWKQSIFYTIYSFLLFKDNGLVPLTHFAKEFKDINVVLGFISWIVLLLAFFRTKKYVNHEGNNVERAQYLLKEYGNSSLDYFKIMDDKLFFFSEFSEGFIAYRVANNFAVVLEEPVSEEDEKEDIITEFEDFCKKNGLKSMYYRVGEDSLQRFESSKKQKLWLGQEAIVDVEKFNLQGKDKKSLRNGLNSLVKKGFVTEVLRAPQSEVILNELESISNEWLEEFNKSEIVFAEGKFDKDLLKYQDIIVVKNESGKIETFMNLIPDFSPSELTYDMIRRTKDAIGGSMDSVIVKLIEEAQARNIKFVNMGLTPLAGNDEPNNVAEKLIQIAYHRLESLKRYQTMRSFKEKYADIWENKYIVYGNEVELLQLPTALNKVMKPDVTKD